MKTKVGLETVASAFPEKVVTAKDQEYLRPLVPKPMRETFKFPSEVRRLRDDNAAEILGLEAARKALNRVGLKPSDIDLIISNQSGGKYAVPYAGAYIHQKLGLSRETPVINIAEACSSFIDGCHLAWNFILTGNYKRILLVTISVWETIGGCGRGDMTDVLCSCFGDGAGAAVVSSQNLKCEFISYYNRTFGELYKAGGKTIMTPVNPGLKGAPDQPPVSLYFEANNVFYEWWGKNSERFGIDGINGALRKANLTLSDLDVVVFHQPFEGLFDQWIAGAEKAGLSKDKWKHTWHKYGNLAPAVIGVNMAEYWERNEFKKDSIIAWIAIGSGGHAPSMIVKWLA